MSIEGASRDSFIATVRRNPVNAALLDRLPALALPDCCLVAGCLCQTVWNLQSSRPPTENIHDYDVFYFDRDLSYESEGAAITRASAAFADLDVKIEVRNQARVHLWYEQHFGKAYSPLAEAREGIDRFLIACTCVGIKPSAGSPAELYTTHGLGELFAGIVKANPNNIFPIAFTAKCQSYQSRWPWLQIEL